MFDGKVPGPEALAAADDAVVVAAVAGWAQVEAAAAARRLAAVAELVRRRVANGPVERNAWSCDNWDGAAAEIAAAQHISHGMASSQMCLAVALRDRLPRVGELFLNGSISPRLATTMAWHTNLIDDDEALTLVDKALSKAAATLGPLSVTKTAEAIDALVDQHDPGALRRTRRSARGREVIIDTKDGAAGTAALWGRLYALDAAVLDRRLSQMAAGVCAEDPRTLAQRRADALGALAAGAETLACGCGRPDCPATTDARATGVLIHVVAEQSALEAQPDPHMSGEERARRKLTPDMTLDEALAPGPEPEPDPPAVKAPSGRIAGGGAVPAPLLAELIRGGAKVKPLWSPAEIAPEPGYRPSAGLAAFVRCRDLTCRFPGCDRPAEFCDIDHAVPYPFGPTHPSNLRCVCRRHHLLKTFWAGAGGWTDRQLPDGTIIWTSPTGATYTTHPGSRLLFPNLCRPTGELPPTPTSDQPPGDRGLMMPTRKRTREQDRASRIKTERALNDAHVAERNRPPPF